MIRGAHAIIFSSNSEADRDFFRDVLKLRFADAGHGWLIFALPPAELAFHPSDKGGAHELYLMCDDAKAFQSDMKARGVATTPLQVERWGILTHVTLPSGGKLGVYQPTHASPWDARKTAKRALAAKKRATKKRATKKPAKKAVKKRRSR